MKSIIPWQGGKSKLLWLIHLLAPEFYSRFIDVFGGSATVTLNHPIRAGCMEVYNDFDKELVNLMRCARDQPLLLAQTLSFLPLHSHTEFDALLRFLSQEEITDCPPDDEAADYEEFQNDSDILDQWGLMDIRDSRLLIERALAKYLFLPEQSEIITDILLMRAGYANVYRAAAYYRKIRESFSSGGKSFAGKPCNIRQFVYDIWECSRRLKDVVIENRDFEQLIRQYDRPDAFFYCDPPYFDAEDCYNVPFPKADHKRLHRVLKKIKGKVMVSYNYCPFICKLYRDFYIFHTKRQNNMSQTAGSEYEEVVMTNYDPRKFAESRNWQMNLFQPEDEDFCGTGEYELIHEPNLRRKS